MFYIHSLYSSLHTLYDINFNTYTNGSPLIIQHSHLHCKFYFHFKIYTPYYSNLYVLSLYFRPIVQMYALYHQNWNTLCKYLPYIIKIGTHYENFCLISLKLRHIMNIWHFLALLSFRNLVN